MQLSGVMPGASGRTGPRWRRPVAAAGIVLVLAAGLAAWTTARGLTVRDHLRRAGTLIEELRRQVQAGDTTGARTTLATLRADTAAARAATGGWDWRLGAAIPGIGTDVGAVRTVAAVLDDLSQDTLPAMLDVAAGLDLGAVMPRAGRLDLSSLRQAAPRVAAIHASVERAVGTVAAIPREALVGPLAQAVAALADGLARVRALTGTAARAAALVPSMLGEDGPRTYLVLFQNLTEVRATGGLAGSFVVVTADHGQLRIVDQNSVAQGLISFPEPVLPLDPAMKALYSDRLGMFPGDVNATPHFPTAAALAREMYRRRSGTTVDGVLATDPVALSYLLRSTGPLSMPAGPALTADNAVRVLLADAYARMSSTADTAAKDAYFTSAARTVFDALSRGAAEPRTALAALARAAGERRLLVWSAHADEEQALAGTVLEGSMPTSDGDRPTVGVFLNDGSGAKLGYYLTHDVAVAVTGCRSDGRRSLRLRVTVGSTAPSSGLPPYVLGLGLAGDPYTIRTQVMVFSPAGGSVIDAALDGAPVRVGSGRERGRGVAIVTVDTRPGQRRTLDANLLTAPVGGGPVTPALWVTPSVNPWSTDVSSAHLCTNSD